MLERVTAGGIAWREPAGLRARHGIVVAFTERTGGCSAGPYASLDLAGHVGDDPAAVDENRSALLAALGIDAARERLTMPEQVHGTAVLEVTGAIAGMGAHAGARASTAPPVPGTDALLTAETGVPLMLCFADCVPVVLVATAPVRAVAVVHAGWRGALGRLPGRAAERLAARAGCGTDELIAFVGPHIGPCHYEVDAGLLTRFVEEFGDRVACDGRLDLGAAVAMALAEAGVPPSAVDRVGACTAERTDAFFSYRAEGLTGRHGALACVLGTPA